MKSRFLLLSVLLFASCNGFEQVVNIELPEHTPALSLFAGFNAQDSILDVQLGQSAHILASSQDLSLDVTPDISVFRNGELLTEDFFCQTGDCFALLPQILGAGQDEYRIELAAPGWETATATQRMPSKPIIKEIEIIPDGTIDEEGYPADAINILIQDPPDEENYYVISVSTTTYYLPDPNNPQDTVFETYGSTLYSNVDPIFIPVYLSEPLTIFSDATFNGQSYWLRFYNYGISGNESATIKLSGITKDGYLFYRSYAAYEESKYNPFAEPVIVHQNVENGHGIFFLQNEIREKVVF